MPTSRDMAIFVLTTTQPITLSLAHARGVKSSRYYNIILYNVYDNVLECSVLIAAEINY